MLCSSAALSKKTVAAAIARPACTRCLRGHREAKRSSVACFDCRRKGEQESQFLKNGYSTRYVRREQYKIYLATVQETTNSSAWNHMFNFQRRGPPRRRSWKLLSLCHTHRSAPRSPYLPCQIMVQRNSSEHEQNYGISCRKN